MDYSIIFVFFATIVLQNADCAFESRSAINSRFNFFDIDLLRYSAEDKPGNIMISPASIKSTLSMLLEGSEGDTADELRKALRLSPNREEFREQLNVYLSTLQANTTSSTLENSNAIFVSDKLRPKKAFQTLLQRVYYSDILPTNFLKPEAAAHSINSWVSNRTRGLIATLVEPFNIAPTSSMLVLNALYFKGTWKNAFNPQLTRSSCFFLGTKCKKTNMMELHTELNYATVDNLRAHAVELPYEGDRYSMIILIPFDKDGCLSLIRDLPYMSLGQVLELMEPNEVQLSLPRFTVDYSGDLVQVLKDVRINSLFSSSANLGGIFDDDQAPQVNNIFHKTHLEVNEIGTVAAAATGAMVVPLMGSSTIQVKADRPFLFFIRDVVTGAVLFEGKLEEPEPAVDGSKGVNQVDQEATSGRSSTASPKKHK